MLGSNREFADLVTLNMYLSEAGRGFETGVRCELIAQVKACTDVPKLSVIPLGSPGDPIKMV